MPTIWDWDEGMLGGRRTAGSGLAVLQGWTFGVGLLRAPRCRCWDGPTRSTARRSAEGALQVPQAMACCQRECKDSGSWDWVVGQGRSVGHESLRTAQRQEPKPLAAPARAHD
jgi:hypothetical protein